MVADSLTLTFSALSDPTRRAILARLARGEATVNDLAAPFEISLPAISKHLAVLERSGLIERRKTSRYRPCRLRPAPLKEATDWIERYRRTWEESFDKLDDYLARLQEKKGQVRKPSGKPRASR
jgi:DNA-binding transcriptional ArsR family regulator